MLTCGNCIRRSNIVKQILCRFKKLIDPCYFCTAKKSNSRQKLYRYSSDWRQTRDFNINFGYYFIKRNIFLINPPIK
ncbi:hypothetical protein PUN28_009312 [Cardiocondyla obscurior]|uniref:Uncharacterized protein n=1 Tax=Cardiocondyla obscurior TaxID=286306 RepID=A0AAW2FRE7_9HYME